VNTAAELQTFLESTPRAARALGRIIVVTMLLGIAILAFVPWQQNIEGNGRVLAFAPLERQQEIDAPIEGRVTRWYVGEGSKVALGELLLEISDNDADILKRLDQEKTAVIARKDAAVLRVAAMESRQLALNSARGSGIKGAQNRLLMSKERTKSAAQLLESAQASQLASKQNIERQTKLFEQGLSSARSVEVAQFENVRAVTEVQRAEAALSSARSEELAVEADRFRVEHDLTASIDDARASEAVALAEEASAAAELARLEVRLSRQSSMEVRAPIAGTVLRLLQQQGNTFVKAGDALLILVPDTNDRVAEVWVDGNDMPLLDVGRPVRLQFEGWPAVQFSGWPSIAVGSFGGIVSLIDSADDGTGRFRILVKPNENEHWPTAQYLRQGVRVHAWVLLDQVKLGFELWRRFNGFPQSVKPLSKMTVAKEEK
jgi:membrane fusion protein, adhesin transport system